MASLASFYGRFAKARRAGLIRGLLASLGLVALRLGLPWPLVRLVKPWLKSGGEVDGVAVAWRGGLLFFAIFVGLGCCDYLARIWFARFAVDIVGDLRASAPPLYKKRRGDYLARMIGDTARLKEGLKGFLIHVATNGLLCLGLLIVLFLLDWSLALIFAGALLAICALTGVFTKQVLGRSLKLRRREGRLADTIHESQGSKSAARRVATGPQVKPSSKRPTAGLTVLQGRATWMVHVVLALAVLGCLVLARPGGARELAPEELLVFMTYMLHSYHPVVRLARQLTRIGKLVACAQRVQDALQPEPKPAPEQPLPTLRRGLEWHDYALASGNRGGGGLRLGPLSLRVAAGETVAVVGPRGAGKSSFLDSLLVRSHTKSRGSVSWEDLDLTEISTKARGKAICGRKALERPALLAQAQVLVLDDAFDRVPASQREAALERVLELAEGQIVLVSMRRPFGLARFDHVVCLDQGLRVPSEVAK